VVFTQHGGISTTRQMEVSIVFGGMITILVYGIGPISGGNLNPAVSLALALSQKISPLRLVAYTAAQCLGAICGTGIVRIMNPKLFDLVEGGANEIHPDANPTEAYGVEFGCTFLLVFTVMVATDAVRSKSNPHIGSGAPIVIGLAVTLAHFVAIPVDNCSINPARSFGVSAISGNWNDHHVFWCVLRPPPPPPPRARATFTTLAPHSRFYTRAPHPPILNCIRRPAPPPPLPPPLQVWPLPRRHRRGTCVQLLARLPARGAPHPARQQFGWARRRAGRRVGGQGGDAERGGAGGGCGVEHRARSHRSKRLVSVEVGAAVERVEKTSGQK
jgi:MIP family channel proteins